MKKLLSILLVLTVLFTTVFVDTRIVSAEEYSTEEYYFGDLEEDDPVPEPNVEIDVSQRIVSFGQVIQGDASVPAQLITVVNKSDITIQLDYQLSDAEGAFEIICSGMLSMAPNETRDLYVKVNPNKGPGYYTAGLIVCPLGYYGAAMNIGISAEVVAPQPRITYFSMEPTQLDLTPGASFNFSSGVRGENGARTDYRWSVSGNTSSATTVDPNGHLEVGKDETSSRIAVSFQLVAFPEYNITANVNIVASNYSVSTSANPTNGGTTAGGCTVKGGQDVEVVAAPSNGFRFMNWTADGAVVSNNPKCVLKNVRKNYNLVANFEPVNCYVKVLATHPEGGTITNSANVPYNGSISLTATPKNGYSFEGWYEGGKKFSSDQTVKLNNIVNNREITANFEQTTFTVRTQVTPEKSGSVSNDASYKKGAKAAISAKPNEGYEFDYWSVNNNVVSKEANYTLNNVDRDYVFVAHFKKKNAVTYPIASSVADANGTISPAGTVNVAQGTDITYTFAPNKGYTIGAVYVDSKNMGATTSYTFKKVTGAHSISVSFIKIPEQKTKTEAKVVTPKTEEKPKKEEKVVVDIIPEHDDVDEGIIDTDEEYRPDDIENEHINDFLDYTGYTGILQKLNLSPEGARSMIELGADMELLEMACQEQYLSVSVHNEYADEVQETESKSFMEVASIPNMGEVVSALMTEDEKMEVLSGGSLALNFNLVANNQLQTEEDKQMLRQVMKDKLEVGHFFEIIFTKSVPGSTEMITELPVPMQIEIKIPESIRANGREFAIMRSHQLPNGALEITYLKNESTDQSKIVFTTDKFSRYAIVYTGGKNVGFTMSTALKIIIAAWFASVIVVIIVAVTILRHAHRRRRRRRAAR